MHVDQFIFRLAILLLPGIAAYKVYRQFKSSTGFRQKQRKNWEYFLDVLLFSLVGYLLIWVGAELVNLVRSILPHQSGQSIQPIQVNMLKALLDEQVQVDYLEIFVTVIVALALGIACAWATNKKIAFKLLNWIRITNQFGDNDVWSQIMDFKDLDWAIVRDHKLDLVYYGQVTFFSDSGEKRELYLRNVQVHDSSWALMYTAENLYISRDDYDLSIELVPEVGNDKQEQTRELTGRNP